MGIRKLAFAVTAGTLLLAGTALAELELKPYGDAQYRLRGAILSAKDDDNSESAFNYSNLLSWRGGVKAKVDDQLSLQLQIGNDWGAAEGVSYKRQKDRSPVLVHLAYGTWNPGAFFISAGVLPVNSHGSLDLLESSLNGGNYKKASFDGWSTRANNSLAGLKLGAPVVKGDVKVGVELLTSITESREDKVTQLEDTANGGMVPKEDPKANPSAVLFVLDIPVSAGALKITPQMAMVLNRLYNRGEEKSDHEMIFGGSAAYKVNDQLSLNLMGAYGMLSNENTKAKDAKTAELNGMIIGVGGSYKVGPGSAQLEYKMSTHDTNADNTDVAYHYIDARYTIKAHSKFTIAPRWRTYITAPNEKIKKGYSQMENRPELILTASF